MALNFFFEKRPMALNFTMYTHLSVEEQQRISMNKTSYLSSDLVI